MRRLLVTLILAFASVVAVACSSDSNSLPTGANRTSYDREGGDGGDHFHHRHHPIACRPFDDDLMQDLFSRRVRPIVRAAIHDIRFNMRRGNVNAARTQMFQLWDLVLKAFYAGDLRGGMSNDTQDNVLEFGQLLYCLVGLDGSGLSLGDALGTGDITQVVFPSGQDQDVVNGTGDGGVRVPGGSLNQPATVTISLITDVFDPFKGPLNTKLDQYGPFFEMHIVPEGSITAPVLIAECLVGTAGDPPPSTHLAHNVGAGIEILGKEPSFLDCGAVGSNGPSAREYYAHGQTLDALKALGRAALDAMTPANAYAGGVGVGGKTSSFSPYGGVDTAVVIEATSPAFQLAPVGSAVASPPTVLVRTTGAQTPLDGANIAFAIASGGGSLTGPSAVTGLAGTAAVGSWTLGAGANSLTASGAFPAPPTGTGVGINGSPVVFTATGGDLIPWEGDGYKYLVGPADQTPGFEATSFNDASWATGRGGFSDHNADNLYCPIDASAHTNWNSVPTPTDMLLRHTFTLPAGWTQSLTLSVAIDNDIQVFVNGVAITDGFVSHEGCATRGSFTFTIPSSALVAGTNVLAVRARDRGVDAFVDVQLVVTP